jgi:hypothetical protein
VKESIKKAGLDSFEYIMDVKEKITREEKKNKRRESLKYLIRRTYVNCEQLILNLESHHFIIENFLASLLTSLLKRILNSLPKPSLLNNSCARAIGRRINGTSIWINIDHNRGNVKFRR